VTIELANYDIFPKVFPKETDVSVTIKPLGAQAAFNSDITYTLSVRPLTAGQDFRYPNRPNACKYEVKPCEDGCIRFTHSFVGEQEHYIRLTRPGEEKKFLQLSVYSLDSDLVGRYPYIGDLHSHSRRSDGRDAPAIVAASYRKKGYDFFSLTDHRRYYPSLEAINAYKSVPIDLNIVAGEEIHLKPVNDLNNDVHIVNFGGEYSINQLFEECIATPEVGTAPEVRSLYGLCPDIISPQLYYSEVEALAKTLNIPDNIEWFTYASCVWIFNRIREAGGLGIFAHPYWISDVFQVPEEITDYILKTKPFDAFELFGGEDYYEQNGFQTAKYYENRENGIHYPVVGSSDSHNQYGDFRPYDGKTIVFSPKNERKALIASIKDFYTVVVDCVQLRMAGDFRFIKYGNFLLKNYFPIHDEYCFEEGRAMKGYVTGEEDAAELLKILHGRTDKLLKKYFKF